MPARALPAAVLAAVLAFSASAAAAPLLNLQYSLDGTHYRALAPISSGAPAMRYYSFFANSGHPTFGTDPDTASFALYWDTGSRHLSLLFVAGHDQTYWPWPRGGNAAFTLEGLPARSHVVLADEPGEVRYRPGSGRLRGDFSFTRNADGLVLGGLHTHSFTIRVLPTEFDLDNLRLMDGRHGIDLDPDQPFYLRAQFDGAAQPKPRKPAAKPPAEPEPVVPEPSATALLALAAASLLRRWR